MPPHNVTRLIPAQQRRDAREYERLVQQHEGRPIIPLHEEQDRIQQLLRQAGYRKTLFERFVDEAADLIANLIENPSLAFVCTGLGLAVGMLSTVGLAFVWSWFL